MCNLMVVSMQCALFAFWLVSCVTGSQRLESPPFRLEARQFARLTVRHTLFCAGGKNLAVTLGFFDDSGSALATKRVSLRCGDSALLDVLGEKSLARRLTARLDFKPRPAPLPVAELEVITPKGSGQDTSAVYTLSGVDRNPDGRGSEKLNDEKRP